MAAQIAGNRSLQVLFRKGCGDLSQHQKAVDRSPRQLRAGPFLQCRGFISPDAPGRPYNTDPCETMSTETQNSPQQGDSRRRRSRGRQNRNNHNRNNHRRDDQGRQSGSNQRSGRQSGSGQTKRRSMPAPKLSWWQKLLKALGFGAKEAVRPPRPERRADTQEPKQSQEPRRSKTRDARSESSDPSENNGKKRREQGERNNTRQRGGDPSTVENRRVYVGNLSYETTESDLEELFKGVGAVRRVEIVYNRSTHRSKGYGFVEMLDIDEAKRTVEVLNDQFFMGRKITVSGAKSKDYDEAEKAEGPVEAAQNVIPPLAPIQPVKEEVMDLFPEPAAQTVAEATPETFAEEAPAEEPKQVVNA